MSVLFGNAIPSEFTGRRLNGCVPVGVLHVLHIVYDLTLEGHTNLWAASFLQQQVRGGSTGGGLPHFFTRPPKHVRNRWNRRSGPDPAGPRS